MVKALVEIKIVFLSIFADFPEEIDFMAKRWQEYKFRSI